MKSRTAKLWLLATVGLGTLFQAGCVTDLLTRIAIGAFLDAIISPLTGNNCSIIDRSGC